MADAFNNLERFLNTPTEDVYAVGYELLSEAYKANEAKDIKLNALNVTLHCIIFELRQEISQIMKAKREDDAT